MKSFILMFTIVLFVMSGLVLAGDEVNLKKVEVPEAVLKAFEESNTGSIVTEYTKKIIDGQIQFEIETKIGSGEKDFIYSADGVLLQIDEDMSVKSLPSNIKESVTKAYPRGVIEEADKITKGSIVEYEITLEMNESDYTLLVSSEGKILESSQIGNDEDESGDIDQNDEEDDD